MLSIKRRDGRSKSAQPGEAATSIIVIVFLSFLLDIKPNTVVTWAPRANSDWIQGTCFLSHGDRLHMGHRQLYMVIH